MRQLVKITPKTLRAKNRVSTHGEKMLLVRRDIYKGESACLVESLSDTWRGQKWIGWLTENEAEVIDIDEEDEPHYLWDPSHM